MQTLTFVPIEDVAALDEVFAASHAEPVVLFLHAPHCPIGLTAYYAMRQLAEPAEVRVIEVAHQRALTRAVEQRTGIKHESPQVIVLRDGAAAWDASHYDITAEAVRSALRAASG